MSEEDEKAEKEEQHLIETTSYLNTLRIYYVLVFSILLFVFNVKADIYANDLYNALLIIFLVFSLLYNLYRYLRPVEAKNNMICFLKFSFFDFAFAGGVIIFTGGIKSSFFEVLAYPVLSSLLRFGIEIWRIMVLTIILIFLILFIFHSYLEVFISLHEIPTLLIIISDLVVLFFVALIAGILVKGERELRKSIYISSITDALTGLYNAAYFRRYVNKWLLDCYSGNNHFTIVFIDLNGFKPINDTYGHLVGDKILKHIANILKQNVREGDIIARYGGDEFIIFLPRTPKEIAEKLAKRLKEKVNNAPYVWEGEKIPLDFSAGVATYPEDGHDLKTMTRVADERMYEQKKKDKMKVRKEKNNSNDMER